LEAGENFRLSFGGTTMLEPVAWRAAPDHRWYIDTK
jgi:hypothetical protein